MDDPADQSAYEAQGLAHASAQMRKNFRRLVLARGLSRKDYTHHKSSIAFCLSPIHRVAL
jgi:hypothetical protein